MKLEMIEAESATRLHRTFFERPARVVAIELIGKVLVFRNHQDEFAGRIVETEAYGGFSDAASHAYKGKTPRNEVMFGKPAVSYVYFTYGNHHCFNVVTESEGTAGAVLIRALEPVSGIESMRKNRQTSDLYQLTSGPGKLTQAFGMTREQNGLDLTDGPLYIREHETPHFHRVVASKRIGITQAADCLLRFFEYGNPHVSTARKSTRKAVTV